VKMYIYIYIYIHIYIYIYIHTQIASSLWVKIPVHVVRWRVTARAHAPEGVEERRAHTKGNCKGEERELRDRNEREKSHSARQTERLWGGFG